MKARKIYVLRTRKIDVLALPNSKNLHAGKAKLEKLTFAHFKAQKSTSTYFKARRIVILVLKSSAEPSFNQTVTKQPFVYTEGAVYATIPKKLKQSFVYLGVAIFDKNFWKILCLEEKATWEISKVSTRG